MPGEKKKEDSLHLRGLRCRTKKKIQRLARDGKGVGKAEPSEV